VGRLLREAFLGNHQVAHINRHPPNATVPNRIVSQIGPAGRDLLQTAVLKPVS
jgi:hypothetical protein